jgi:tetratricopeptide (TPR) repeat protein
MPLYDAFVSYSHARDKPIASALQSVVQKLGKPWYRRRALRVFRDDTSLSATPHLWPSIEQALGQARFFILLASPEAAASKWVNQEASHWLEHNSVDTLLIGLTDGELCWDDRVGDFGGATPLPPALAGRFATEPKWVDLRTYRNGADKGDSRFTELAADFAAAVRGMPKEDLLSQEVREQRRALTLAWSAAGSLLILAIVASGAGILAYRAQQDAIAQRQSAEATLAAATTTANSLVFDLAQRFRDTVGIPADLVKDILTRARSLQEQLGKSGQVTPALRRSQAEALMETTAVLRAIGDTAGALAAAGQARQILADLLAGEPGNTDWQRELAVSHVNIGDVRAEQGDVAGALKSYSDGLAIREALAKSDPRNASVQREWSVSYQRVGDVALQQGDLAGALKSYLDSFAIVERLAKSDPRNNSWQHELAVSYIKIGDAQWRQGSLAAALKSYGDSLAISDRLVQSSPGNARWQSDLSASYERVGNVQRAQGDFTGALQSYSDGLAVAEQLAKSDPGNAGWQRGLSLSVEKVGDVQAAQGEFAGAQKSYAGSLAIMDRLAKSDPRNKNWQSDLARSHWKLGDVLLRQRDFAGALKSNRDSLAIAERLAKSDPGNAGWQRDLAVSYSKVGDVQMAQNDLAGALTSYGDSLAIIDGLAQSNPGNPAWQSDLSVAHGRVGRVLHAQGDLAGALKSYRNRLAIMEDLAKSEPGNITWQRDLWWSYRQVGEVQAAQGDLAGALKSYGDCLAVTERVAQSEPALRQRFLQSITEKLDELAYRFILAHDAAGALEAADQVVSLAPGEIWFHINRTHALMLLDRTDEARTLYLKYRGEKVRGKLWEQAILEDFAELRKAGLTHLLMDEIEKKFRPAG